LAAESTWIERIESPPKAKKLSRTPTCSTPSTRCQIAASCRSQAVRGATYAACTDERPPAGAGSRWRSTLPLGESGSVSSGTYTLGTIASGNRDPR